MQAVLSGSYVDLPSCGLTVLGTHFPGLHLQQRQMTIFTLQKLLPKIIRQEEILDINLMSYYTVLYYIILCYIILCGVILYTVHLYIIYYIYYILYTTHYTLYVIHYVLVDTWRATPDACNGGLVGGAPQVRVNACTSGLKTVGVQLAQQGCSWSIPMESCCQQHIALQTGTGAQG